MMLGHRPGICPKGVGLGLRMEFLRDFMHARPRPIDFLEIAPENWVAIGGWRARCLQRCAQDFPIVCHGLSLSLGGPLPLNEALLQQLKLFFKRYHITCYSEHLSYCSDRRGYLYDLLPIPFTEEAVHYVAARIRQVQDYLEQRIAVENISYYCAPGQVLSEIDFINAVLEEDDCDLLLDVNNVYVNSVNHHYDPEAFLHALPIERVAYIHIAGHSVCDNDQIIDTHGAAVIEPVWRLLHTVYKQYRVFPTLLERDSDIPPLAQLCQETKKIEFLQQSVYHHDKATV